MARLRRRGGVPRLSSRGDLSGGSSAPVRNTTASRPSSPAGEALSVAGRPLRRNDVPYRSDFAGGQTLMSRRNALGRNNIMRQTGEMDASGRPQYAPPIYRGSRNSFDQVPLSFRTNNGMRSDYVQRQLDNNRSIFAGNTYSPTPSMQYQRATDSTYTPVVQQPIQYTPRNYIAGRTTGDDVMSSYNIPNRGTNYDSFMTGTTRNRSITPAPATASTAPVTPAVVNNDTTQLKKKDIQASPVDEIESLYQQIEQFENQRYNSDKDNIRQYIDSSLARIDAEENSYMESMRQQLEANNKAAFDAFAVDYGGGMYDAQGNLTATGVSVLKFFEEGKQATMRNEYNKARGNFEAMRQGLRSEVLKMDSEIESNRYNMQMQRKYEKIKELQALREAQRKEIADQIEFERKYGLAQLGADTKEKIARYNADVRRYGYDVAAQNNLYDYQSDRYNTDARYKSNYEDNINDLKVAEIRAKASSSGGAYNGLKSNVATAVADQLFLQIPTVSTPQGEVNMKNWFIEKINNEYKDFSKDQLYTIASQIADEYEALSEGQSLGGDSLDFESGDDIDFGGSSSGAVRGKVIKILTDAINSRDGASASPAVNIDDLIQQNFNNLYA